MKLRSQMINEVGQGVDNRFASQKEKINKPVCFYSLGQFLHLLKMMMRFQLNLNLLQYESRDVKCIGYKCINHNICPNDHNLINCSR